MHRYHSRQATKNITMIVTMLLMATMAHGASADTLAVSSMGFHPDAAKRAMLYSTDAITSVGVHDASSGALVATYPLQQPKNYEGQTVACQGNLPCRVADFSSLTAQGDYYLTAGPYRSHDFNISSDIYKRNAPTLLEFYDATLQQGSDYHPNLHAAQDPSFPFMADGSFLMEADQAAATMIRLGSAYREDPSLFTADNHVIIGTGLPDLPEYLDKYAKYLLELQGVQVHKRYDGVGLRAASGFNIAGAFTPGAVGQSTAKVYFGSHGGDYQNVSVTSLCGPDDGSFAWDACVSYAADNYKCELGEVCLNLTYNDATVSITGTQGYDVVRGWSYEFQCFPDIATGSPVFSSQPDQCLIFNTDTNQNTTARSALAFMEVLPAVHAIDPATAQLLLKRTVNTLYYLNQTYPTRTSEAAGFAGAAAFLVYDATGDESYLRMAYALRNDVATTFDVDGTYASEYYWEEYIRHKENITGLGLTYTYGGTAPEEFFRGKMWFDYKDRWVSISDSGEHVFDGTPGAGDFQESRPMLVEGLIAAKTAQLHPSPEAFISTIADAQLAWLTGGNQVQDGIAQGSLLASYSFITGVGIENPTGQHTRLKLDTGLSANTGGALVGARSSQYFFENPDVPGTYVMYDGVSDILGQRFGSTGNGWRNESTISPFTSGRVPLIPGWVSGAYDVGSGEQDTIFNFDDKTYNWRFTESTNEMVAAAVELFAYLDAAKNGRPRAVMPSYALSSMNLSDDGIGTTLTPVCGNGLLESGEQCDDGNTLSGDGCSASCTIESTPVCGNGVLESGEQCDDGNTVSGDGCSSSCQLESTNTTTCASSIAQLNASCSGGAFTSDVVSGSCRSLTCEGAGSSLSVLACDKPDSASPQYFEMYKQSQNGTGVSSVCLGGSCITSGEYDGYARGPDYASCGAEPSPVCGNGVLESGEQCDDGNTFSYDGCSSSCQVETPVCGNGHVESGEQCDDGNTFSGDGCSSTCTIESSTCASSIAQLNATCSGGSLTSDVTSGSCRSLTCEGAGSSLSVLACDKPDSASPQYFEMYKQSQTGSAVSAVCLSGSCITSGEYDGYTRGPDYASCGAEPSPVCGNGVLESGEQCDDGNTVSYDGCSSSCQVETPVCGNGHVESGEQCDDGNTLSGDGCSATCQVEGIGVDLHVKQWYPKGRDYVFVCAQTGFDALGYEWSFGDGNQQATTSSDVYHTYASAGPYNVSCTANGDGVSADGTLAINVS